VGVAAATWVGWGVFVGAGVGVRLGSSVFVGVGDGPTVGLGVTDGVGLGVGVVDGVNVVVGDGVILGVRLGDGVALGGGVSVMVGVSVGGNGPALITRRGPNDGLAWSLDAKLYSTLTLPYPLNTMPWLLAGSFTQSLTNWVTFMVHHELMLFRYSPPELS